MHADVSDLTSHPPGRDLEMRDGRPLLRVAAHGGGACPAELVSASGERVGHLRVTVAPAPSSASLALSAVALSTFSTTAFGAASTSSLASFRPREVRARTSLMTLIFLSPAASRMTSKESFSSPPAASPPAPPAAGAAATATGAAAVTPKVSSNCFTNSESSMRVISLNASSSSSVLSFAMVAFPFGTGPFRIRMGLVSGGVRRPGLRLRRCRPRRRTQQRRRQARWEPPPLLRGPRRRPAYRHHLRGIQRGPHLARPASPPGRRRAGQPERAGR